MYYAFSARRYFLIAIFIAISVPLLFGSREAVSAAGEIECRVLLAKAMKAGERPAVYYAKDWGIIHIQTSSEKCVEPIEVWKARHLKWKVIKLAKGATPPEIKSAKKQSVPIKKTLPNIRRPKAERIFSPPVIPGGPLYSADCNRKLDEFWFQDMHMINGQPYWLSDVYTVDHNGDGIVDNIGFRLKSQGLPDVNIRYFAAKGKVQGSDMVKLKLVSDKVIPWICFGRISFAEPPGFKPPDKLFNKPDLAADIIDKQNPETKAKETKAKEETKNNNESKVKETKSSGLMFWLLTGLGVLIIGGGGAFWFVKLRHGSDDKDEEEDEDEPDV